MKDIIFLSIFIIGICAENNIELWQKFKIDHKRIYITVREEARRFEIFKENVREIEEHNAKYARGESTYYKGINKFTDMTIEELSEKYLTKVEPFLPRNEALIRVTDEVSESKNWTAEGVVTEVKDQESCGACYAFASVAAIESGNAIVNKELINLSVQQLIDCSIGNTYLNYGCAGGIIEGSIHYVMDHGIEAQESYPYESNVDNCRANASLNVVSVKAYKNVPENQTLLKEAVGTIGPVAAAIDASEFFSYEGGIISGDCFNKRTNHVILIAGYGHDEKNQMDYWYVKNSWGPSWGEHGYVKVLRNGDNDFCISTYTAYPIMK